MIESQITFETPDGRELLLEGVNYDVQIDGLMAKTAIAQNYANPYDTNIEAVYTFPLTPDAVLMGIEIRINEIILKGTIKEKTEAESEYEEAIDEGNRAIMVEKSSDGIYTVSIANILPEDKISVIIKYTQLLEWRQDQVRWSLPTTIAPKYGEKSGLNLDDVTDPSISLLAENRFGLQMRIKGILADSKITAPSHQIVIEQKEDETLISHAKESDFMDKDIVFTFKTVKARNERSFALVDRDFEGYAAIASFYPSFGVEHPRVPKSVTFVIDCSGSMMGVSIDRARMALHKALALLTPEDAFNIVKFGSDHSMLFNHEVPATQKNINIAKRMVRSLDADMGGTEMAAALQSAYNGHNTNEGRKGYLFLITDGEIYEHGRVINNAKKSEMAHYVVGVGYASDDPLLRKIAIETRGSYESVDPNEKMDDYILHLFKKIDMPKANNIQIAWPTEPKFAHMPSILFDGDTLYAYATFDKEPTGTVALSYALEDGSMHAETVIIGQTGNSGEEEASSVAKMVIAKEIDSLNGKRSYGRFGRWNADESEENRQIVTLSTKYQLFSELTNYILVDEVEENEKPTSLPQVYKVDSMMVESNMVMESRASHSVNAMASPTIARKCVVSYSLSEREDTLSVPTFLRKTMDDESEDDYPFGETELSQSTELLDGIDTSKYDMLLGLFSDCYKKYHRLPRKRSELLLMGLEPEITGRLIESDFRAQIKVFVLALYEVCTNKDALAKEFVSYIENRLMKNEGIRNKILDFRDYPVPRDDFKKA